MKNNSDNEQNNNYESLIKNALKIQRWYRKVKKVKKIEIKNDSVPAKADNILNNSKGILTLYKR
jgi:hypothetical protein